MQREIRAKRLCRDRSLVNEAEQQLRTIIDAAPTPTVISRFKDGKIVFANRHMATMMGSSAEELIGRVTLDFYYDPNDRKSLLDRLLRDGVLNSYELRLKRIDGSPFWALLSAVLADLNGDQVLIAGISDISNQKSAEEALQRERNFVSAVLDIEAALVVVLDT